MGEGLAVTEVSEASQSTGSRHRPDPKRFRALVLPRHACVHTRAAIEKMAEEFARDMLKDPEFRQYLRDEATKAAHEIARALREPPEASE